MAKIQTRRAISLNREKYEAFSEAARKAGMPLAQWLTQAGDAKLGATQHAVHQHNNVAHAPGHE